MRKLILLRYLSGSKLDRYCIKLDFTKRHTLCFNSLIWNETITWTSFGTNLMVLKFFHQMTCAFNLIYLNSCICFYLWYVCKVHKRTQQYYLKQLSALPFMKKFGRIKSYAYHASTNSLKLFFKKNVLVLTDTNLEHYDLSLYEFSSSYPKSTQNVLKLCT